MNDSIDFCQKTKYIHRPAFLPFQYFLRCLQRVEEQTQTLRMKRQQQEDEMERQHVELLVHRKALEDDALRERRRIEEEERTRRIALSVQVIHSFTTPSHHTFPPHSPTKPYESTLLMYSNTP